MLENDKLLNEVDDEELGAVAGGGIYTKDGFLKTTIGYSCSHFMCKQDSLTERHLHVTDGCQGKHYVVKTTCRYCGWHSTLRCNNPANKR